MILTLFVDDGVDKPFIYDTVDVLKGPVSHTLFQAFNILADLRNLILEPICDVIHLSVLYNFLFHSLDHFYSLETNVA